MSDKEKLEAYWKKNLSLIFKILVIWFLCSYFAGIMIVELMSKIQIGGYPLGFWFAQQGSIYIFVALIFIYSKLMEKLDEKFGLHEA